MNVSSLTRGLCLATAAAASNFANATIATEKTITVKDIAGRTVEVEKNPSKVVIGEGRMIYSIALLDQENPFARIAGWKNDMVLFDPDASYKLDRFSLHSKSKNTPFDGAILQGRVIGTYVGGVNQTKVLADA